MDRRALVVGAEIFSRILDWNDRGTCVLFGDGAGAVVLEASSEPGLLASELHADGRIPASCACRGHAYRKASRGPRRSCTMDGPAVFKFAVKVLGAVRAERAAASRAWTLSQLDWLIPHQANVRIMDATAKAVGCRTKR